MTDKKSEGQIGKTGKDFKRGSDKHMAILSKPSFSCIKHFGVYDESCEDCRKILDAMKIIGHDQDN